MDKKEGKGCCACFRSKIVQHWIPSDFFLVFFFFCGTGVGRFPGCLNRTGRGDKIGSLQISGQMQTKDKAM